MSHGSTGHLGVHSKWVMGVITNIGKGQNRCNLRFRGLKASSPVEKKATGHVCP